MSLIGYAICWYFARRLFLVDVPSRHRWRATALATLVTFTVMLSMALRS